MHPESFERSVSSPPARYIVPDDIVPPHRGAVSFWTVVKRNGDWLLPRSMRLVAIMGGIELDLRDARVGAGTSTIDLRCIWGNVEIIVPPDVHLDCDVDALAGSSEVKRDTSIVAPPGAPTLRIVGTVLMGNVEVKIQPRTAVS